MVLKCYLENTLTHEFRMSFLLSLLLGREATLATGQLLKMVGLNDTAAAQHVHLMAMLSH